MNRVWVHGNVLNRNPEPRTFKLCKVLAEFGANLSELCRRVYSPEKTDLNSLLHEPRCGIWHKNFPPVLFCTLHLYMDLHPKECLGLICKWALSIPVTEETPLRVTFHKPQREDSELWALLGCRRRFPLVYLIRGPGCARRGVSTYSLSHKKTLNVFLPHLDTFLSNPGINQRFYQDADCSNLSQLGAIWFPKEHLAMSAGKLRRLLLGPRDAG